MGPDDCWHVDGYDKLKQYGFPIHGCIDGFSRKILWLHLVTSNNDPYTIADLFLNHVSITGVIPKRVRTDCGTENGILAATQCYFRRNNIDEHAGVNVHLYGSSHSNQRIEAWWSCYRRSRSSYIINVFKDLVKSGEYNPDDNVEKACSIYCFSSLIQDDLNQCQMHWNSHYIRKSQYSDVFGRPNYLYLFPGETYANQACEVLPADLDEIKVYIDDWLEEDDDVYTEYFNYLCRELNLIDFKTLQWNDAIEQFLLLLRYAKL